MWSGAVSERKVSKRLKLVKRVREHYTREDVPCGFECCSDSCKINMGLSVFVIPTAEVIVKYKALFKSEYVAAIICQSVLSELSRNEEKNFRKTIKDKGYIVFCNELCRSTYGEGLNGVLEFYKSHLPQHKFIILDLENIRDYNEHVSEDIGDLLEAVEEKEKTNYEEYREDLEIMWKRGHLYRGSLQVSMHNCYSGFILDGDSKILVIGKTNMNRAMHGDEVYVEAIDEKDEDLILLEADAADTTTKDGQASGDGVFGKIVGIHQRKCRMVIGTISQNTVHGSGTQNVLVLPMDRRIPAIRIRTSQVDDLVNRRLCIEIDDWERTSNYPTGHYYKRMSAIGDRDGEVEAILMVNGINYHDLKWSKLLEELSISEDSFNLSGAYKEVEVGNREDLRSLDVMSIDPPGCTDIDDALHFKPLSNGNLEVGVHIADVTLYVDKDSPLDGIAADRGTTVYLPWKRIDMLPPVLSGDLCSLVENKDRAAFSVIWEMSRNAEVLGTHFCRSLIKSRKSLSYEEADRIIRGTSTSSSEIRVSLGKLHEISKILRKKRLDNGSLDLSTKELVFTEDGLEAKEHLQTNSLVEEFMLLANTTVASFIHHYSPDTSLLRRHLPPSALTLGPELDTSSSKSLNESLSRLDETKRDIVKRSLIKSMNQARYFISGDTADFHHYGLAIPIYTHFTSPIRRYADMVVHRIINNILHASVPSENIRIDGLGLVSFSTRKETHSKECLGNAFIDESTCRNINLRHRSAQKAAWECNKLATYLILRDAEPTVDAHVIAKKSNGVILYIQEYNIEEAILSNKHFETFQHVRVRIIRDDEKFFIKRRFSLEVVD